VKSKNIYGLPLKKTAIFLAISDPRAHYSRWKHAIDFSIGFNEPILASLKGEVIDVKDDSKEGGNDEKFADVKYQNYVTIRHANNELSQYVHLAHKSVLVKVGDRVKKGDQISKGIGMVGYTTAPHLHMMVCIEKENKVGFESLEIQFDKKIKIIRTPEEHGKELNELSSTKSL
jgi:murein DD-endopeptidase MepM/ murein hydrolase activator NlpD